MYLVKIIISISKHYYLCCELHFLCLIMQPIKLPVIRDSKEIKIAHQCLFRIQIIVIMFYIIIIIALSLFSVSNSVKHWFYPSLRETIPEARLPITMGQNSALASSGRALATSDIAISPPVILSKRYGATVPITIGQN